MNVISKITITLADNGAVNVEGNLHDKLGCLGLMEIAKHVVMNYKPDKPHIIAPNPNMVPKDLTAKKE